MEPLIAPVLDFVCPSSRVLNPEWISPALFLVCGDPEGHVWCDTCLFLQKGCTLYKRVYGMAARHIPYMLSSAEIGCRGSNGGSPVQSTDALPTRPPRWDLIWGV